MKKFVKFAIVAVFVAVVGVGGYASQKTTSMSDLVLANIEALAGIEDGPTECPGGRHLCAWIKDSLGSVTYYDEDGEPDI